VLRRIESATLDVDPRSKGALHHLEDSQCTTAHPADFTSITREVPLDTRRRPCRALSTDSYALR